MGATDTPTIAGPRTDALSQNSSAVATVGANSITYDADGIGQVAGQAGIQDFVSDPRQEPVSVLLTFHNVNQSQLTYGSAISDPSAGTGRNLLLDGNDSTLSDFANPQTGGIPEPASLMMALLGFFLSRRRDRP